MRPQLVHLAGPEGQDKERFLAELVAALQKRGLAVGLLRGGEEEVSLALPGAAAASAASEVLASLRNLDLVLSLLPPQEGQALVEFAPAGAGSGGESQPGRLAVAGPGRAAEVADLLAERARSRGEKRRINVLVDGHPLPAKPFVQDILANSLYGLLSPLKGTEGASRLEIIIE